jgi:hypothetical protein
MYPQHQIICGLTPTLVFPWSFHFTKKFVYSKLESMKVRWEARRMFWVH